MKRLLWLGVLFLSAGWLFFIPQFTMPDVFIGTLLLILGTICTIGGLSRSVQKQLEIRYAAALLIPVALALLFVPFPYNLGLLVLAIGLLTILLSFKFKFVQTISLGISLSG